LSSISRIVDSRELSHRAKRLIADILVAVAQKTLQKRKNASFPRLFLEIGDEIDAMNGVYLGRNHHKNTLKNINRRIILLIRQDKIGGSFSHAEILIHYLQGQPKNQVKGVFVDWRRRPRGSQKSSLGSERT
jgi:hypothetical protein